ncbi:hypothetical protein ACFOEW_00215 [Alteromonas oceani]|uniref:Uncharacterized protein n=1 Tax=Alteromonas oceani TaxID=2071609 RepID=A0ABV7JQH5_9ALTE|nr:hypothetical protein [Alteromonas oceani]
MLSSAAKSGANIYHIRAGFSQSLIPLSKSLGKKLICNHSIVHPCLINVLIENNGVFPDELPRMSDGIWGAVCDDIKAAYIVVNPDFVECTFKFMVFKKRIGCDLPRLRRNVF